MIKDKDFQDFYILSLEWYKKEKNIDIDNAEINDILENKFVYENIASNYETLMVLDPMDTVEFIDRVIEKTENVLTIYHGSNIKFDRIDLKKSKNFRDFGNGFYCTVLKKQASNWAVRMTAITGEGKPYLYMYKLSLDNDLKIKKFTTFNEEWFEFIIENRSKKGMHHDYDVVIGPIADDNVIKTVNAFLEEERSLKESLEKLKYRDLTNQISLHTEKALKHLKLIVRSGLYE